MKLEHYLDLHKISQNTFAKKMGISHQTINYWINGKREPRMAHMRLITTLTGGKVQPNDFVL